MLPLCCLFIKYSVYFGHCIQYTYHSIKLAKYYYNIIIKYSTVYPRTQHCTSLSNSYMKLHLECWQWYHQNSYRLHCMYLYHKCVWISGIAQIYDYFSLLSHLRRAHMMHGMIVFHHIQCKWAIPPKRYGF